MMAKKEEMIVSVGIDVGTEGAISAITGDHDIIYVNGWNLSKLKGVVRLREMQKTLYDALLDIKKKLNDTDTMIVSIEEPPKVRNQKTYSILCQMLGVAQLVVFNATNSVPLIFNTSTWKSCIGADVSAPTVLRGKNNQAERELHMKNSVQSAVLKYLAKANKNNLRKIITSSTIWRIRTEGDPFKSDAYDALGVASAGLRELEKVSLEA